MTKGADVEDGQVTPEEAQALIAAQASTIGQQQTQILLLRGRVRALQAALSELRANTPDEAPEGRVGPPEGLLDTLPGEVS